MKLCRCCKTRLNGRCFYSIYPRGFYKSMPPTFVEFIKNWLNVTFADEDRLPSKICAFCCNKLKLIVEFVSQIQDSNEKLKNEGKTEDDNKPSTSKKKPKRSSRRCRCCLSTSAAKYHDIHKLYIKPGVTYAAIINDVAKLEIRNNDGLPQKICDNCLKTVENMFDFGLNIRYVDKALRKQAWRPIFQTECRSCRDATAERYHSVYGRMINGQTYANYICQITWQNVEIKEGDGFPQRICDDCLKKLDELLAFAISVRDHINELRENADEERDEYECRFCDFTNPGGFIYEKHIESIIQPEFTYESFLELLLPGYDTNEDDDFDITFKVCDNCVDKIKSMFYFTRKTLVLTDEQYKQLKPWKMSNRSDTDDSNELRHYKGSSNSEDSYDSL